MAKVILDIELCHPEQCARGVCSARKQCPTRAIWQEEPYAPPFLNAGLCRGCTRCVVVCPRHAIRPV